MSSNFKPNPYEILLIENDENDIKLISEAFKELSANYNLTVLENCDDALKFLNKEKGFENSVMPDIILLDLNLNKIDGKDILKKVKQDKNLRKIPVIVLSISDSDKDVDESYKYHANCYIMKPLEYERLVKIVKSIENFWFKLVKLPTRL